LYIENIYGYISYKHVDCLILNKPSVVDLNRNGLSVSISVYVIFVFIFLVLEMFSLFLVILLSSNNLEGPRKEKNRRTPRSSCALCCQRMPAVSRHYYTSSVKLIFLSDRLTSTLISSFFHFFLSSDSNLVHSCILYVCVCIGLVENGVVGYKIGQESLNSFMY
jgi:hypothetical protein